VPVIEVADLPTPVEPLRPIADHAWVKRDDLTHAEYGGNKIRKLEFILADAKARGKNHIVTFGAIGTNHGVATAMLCSRLDMKCTVFLFDQPVTDAVRKNLKLMTGYGAELIPTGSLFRTVLSYTLSRYRWNKRAAFLFAGGSNAVGTLGFVNAVFELKMQIEKGECPAPAKIFCPVGSSATLAGLTLGVHLAGMDCEVVGIRVAPSHVGPFPACTTKTVSRLIGETASLLEKEGVQVGSAPIPTLVDDCFGEGYGVATAGGLRALEVFRPCGVALEQTYTAKAAAAFLDALKETDRPMLFWHTFNSRPPAFELDAVALKPSLQALLWGN
jgi:D-cysteine desulfhydrase